MTRSSRPSGPHTIRLVCAVAAAGALLTGCGSDNADSTAQPEKNAVPSRAVPASAPASPSGRLTMDQIKRKALIPAAKVGYEEALRAAVAAAPNSEPIAAELKGTPSNPYWETAVAASDGTVHSVRVDAVSGKVNQSFTESDDAYDKKRLAARLAKATVTAQQAAQTATEKTKGTVSSLELGDADNGNDKVAWSVDVVTTDDWYKTTYEIDATNRKVLHVDVDTD
ncbi:PepSY domain-containing protein [Streptomyces inhibens]|uniref:PepSY domain-containing protein n=1 Tax=Streptomyces inhibens TaxID=2293571 RepID=UPI001FD40CF7|nr:PepSY domain-containing protein [Streptomyces inhibens]